jgi:hypothetical protein
MRWTKVMHARAEKGREGGEGSVACAMERDRCAVPLITSSNSRPLNQRVNNQFRLAERTRWMKVMHVTAEKEREGGGGERSACNGARSMRRPIDHIAPLPPSTKESQARRT